MAGVSCIPTFGDFVLQLLSAPLSKPKNLSMKNIGSSVLFVCSVLFLLSCEKDKEENNDVVVVTSTGNIENDVNKFRQLLGDPLNTTTGITTGRREINWDGVPDSLLGKKLPDDFFNPTEAGAPVARQRGLAYLPGGGEFRISNTSFADLNPQAAAQFSSFSGTKTFANISSNLWPVDFQVAGQLKAASVKGFGAVFSDVDLDNSTSLEFFNGSKSLGKYFVPPHNATSSFSFLGVYFKNGETITRVMVSHKGFLSGGSKDVTDNGPDDLIVLDDFLYSEPLAQ
jgi:hypothetical protein